MRQLSFAFQLASGHSVRGETKSGSTANGLGFQPVTLRRIDPARNMSRFYSLKVEQDLLGNVVLVRRWGRIGSAGKVRLDAHAGEGEALAALQALKMAKAKKGYQPITRL
jgi:predicted DNA-binding WGR domain protein